MPGIEATRRYIFGEEHDFMEESSYRENMIPLIVNNEDDALAYFNRVCDKIGWREEDYEVFESWFEDFTGSLPSKVQKADLRMLVGEIKPTTDEIIRLLGLLADYDVMEIGSYDIFQIVLEETKATFWNLQQPGEYSNTVLQIWTRQDLMKCVESPGDFLLKALINLRSSDNRV